MKKVISTIVAIGFISSMLANSAYAGDRHGNILNPLWLPAAILSTLAAAVTITLPQQVAYENREHSEPCQTVIYEEPRHNRRAHYYERGPVNHYNYERERVYEAPRYREYREYR
jgi:hypothetical protein